VDVQKKSFWEFLESHELFVAAVDFDPAKVSVREVIAERGIPRSWLQRIEEDFQASELQRQAWLSHSLRALVRRAPSLEFGNHVNHRVPINTIAHRDILKLGFEAEGFRVWKIIGTNL